MTALLQSVTYNEFLPALLGADALDAYAGYDASVNAGISNIFSTAAYRLGHSLLSSELQRVDADGNVAEEGSLSLQAAFFRPGEVEEHGIDSLLQGAATQLAQELDTQVIDDVRNFLFGPPGAGGFDLASLNIQRGRDHGLPDYNQARIDLGLEPVTSFADLTSDEQLAAALEEVYGDINEVDIWVGGLAEDHVPGSSVGETFRTILVDQFTRLRDGDRYWYENVLTGSELEEVSNTRLSDVIERNSGVANLQENVFFSEDVLFVDVDAREHRNVTVRAGGRRLEVVDDRTGSVLARGRTDQYEQVMVMGSSELNNRITVTGHGASGTPAGWCRCRGRYDTERQPHGARHTAGRPDRCGSEHR